MQGEDLFLDGLPEPFRDAVARLIRRQTADVDKFLAVSEFYVARMHEFSASRSTRLPSCHSASTRTATTARGPRATASSGSATLPGRTGEGFARTCRGLPGAATGQGATEVPARGRGVPGNGTGAYLAGIERQMRDVGPGEEFRYHGAVDRAQKIEFLRGLDVLSVPGPIRIPRARTCSRRWLPARPSCSHGGRRRDDRANRRRPARRADHERWPRTADARHDSPIWPKLGRRGAEGVRDTTRSRARPTACWKLRPGRQGQAWRGPSGPPAALKEWRRACSPFQRSPRTTRHPQDREDSRERLVLDGARRGRRDHGAVGQRQEHAALHPRRARSAHRRHGDARRRRSFHAQAQCAGGIPQSPDRVRLPGPRAAAAVFGAGERAGADAGGRARRRRSVTGEGAGRPRRARQPAGPSARRSCRVGRNSAWPSRAR